jgi:hypothetical protein
MSLVKGLQINNYFWELMLVFSKSVFNFLSLSFSEEWSNILEEMNVGLELLGLALDVVDVLLDVASKGGVVLVADQLPQVVECLERCLGLWASLKYFLHVFLQKNYNSKNRLTSLGGPMGKTSKKILRAPNFF